MNPVLENLEAPAPPTYKRLAMTPQNATKIRHGEKTETRRIVNPQPTHVPTRRTTFDQPGGIGTIEIPVDYYSMGEGKLMRVDMPYREGDRCYITEDWGISLRGEAIEKEGNPGFYRTIYYPGDGEEREVPRHLWPEWDALEKRPSKDPDPYRVRRGRFMFRWAARTFVRITGVRVERLHAISLNSIQAEGVRPSLVAGSDVDIDGFFWPEGERKLRREWQALWESIHGADSWTLNPWVWVYAFELIREGE
jgi:hypothetical protein